MCNDHQEPIPGLVLHNWTAPEQVRAFYKGYSRPWGYQLRQKIKAEFMARCDEVAHVVLFTVPYSSRTFAQNRYGSFGAQTVEHRDVTPQ